VALGFNKYTGGDNVRFGFYWNLREWSAQIVPKEGGTLEGTNSVVYLRLPLVALLLLAPLMGAAYAFFLPFIGFAMVLMYLAGKLRTLVTTTPPASEATGGGNVQKVSAARKEAPDHKRAA
jgi:hypothetical protein